MRKSILASGLALLALALILGISYPIGLLFSVPIASLNIILGLTTKKSGGLKIQQGLGGVRMVIDRGVVRASIYQLVFLETRLILKRLTSAMVTVILALVLAILGLEILWILGAIMGGVTGFSLQESLTQRMRNKIEDGKMFVSVEPKDMEIDYADVVDVRLVKSRLYLTTKSGTIAASFPRGYSQKMRPVLADLFKSKFAIDGSVRAT
jgi:hypothetical protein